MKKCSRLTPEVFQDHRGSIRSYYPDESIVEYNLMITRQGDARGYHYHPHFIEYMLIVEGECLFKEYSENDIYEDILHVGDSLRIPVGVPHTFMALTDFKFVSMLTRKWNDSYPPIVKIQEDNFKP